MDESVTPRFIEVGFDEGRLLVEPLLSRHYDEIAQFKDLFEIDVDLDFYRALESQGKLISLVAYLAGLVVGYSCNFISHNVHYRRTLICKNDVLYVAPEHRTSRIGLKLMSETKRLAREHGARLMVWHSKFDTPMDRLLERKGVAILDIIRAERL